jgi:hypothetical protein
MKKLTVVCSMFAAVAAAGFNSGSAQACDHYRRVVYSQPHHIVYSTPVVHSTSVVHSAPVVRTTTLVSKPIVTTTVTKQEVIEIVEKLPEIQQGAVVRAKVRFAGQSAGEVTVKAGNLEMQCEILEWSANLVTFRMPRIDIVTDAECTVQVFTADGSVVKSVKGLLTTPADFEIERPATTLAQQASDLPVQ